VLGGPHTAARLQRKVARARHLIDAARHPTGALRRLRRAERVLGGFIALVRRAQESGRIAPSAAEPLLALSVDAVSQLSPLRAPLP
jgi:hypothetical protein